MPPETIALAPIRARRLPRFRRASLEEQPAFRLTDRDRQLIKCVYENRFLTAEMIQDLVQPVELTRRQQEALERLIAARRAKLNGTGTAEQSTVRTKRKIWHRLMVLYHNGYLQRHKLSDQEPIVYALGNKGADELVLYFGIDRKEIDWTQRARENGERYIRHGLMVSRFRHALVLALRELPGVTLLFWKPGGAFKATVKYEDLMKTREGTRTQLAEGAVIPDGYFALTSGDKTAYFFLEADRSTMSNSRYLGKLKAYYHFWATQIRAGKHPSGMTRFRVLTVTLSQERKDNLRETAREVDAEGKAPNLFWFTCEREYRDVPQQVMGPIWQTLQDDTMKSL
jgi:Replication-relaxation